MAEKAKMRGIIKNKKGFLRIIEAVIAILLILGVLIFVTARSKTRAETDLTDKIPPLLDEIAKDSYWRDQVVTTDITASEAVEEKLRTDFLASRITNPRIQSRIKICKPLDGVCPMNEGDYPAAGTNVFAGERIISAVLPQYDAKKVKIYLWISED